ncbi:C40 family peptidase [Sphaerisporangium perillae]|uniref:C40 family peptidase n=1 Tax=Sphaerisporangium perillae TaxID=2935860 RepID=UPI00200CB7D6|nr:C40 family peptidase [Sphaerisporangium perillae]
MTLDLNTDALAKLREAVNKQAGRLASLGDDFPAKDGASSKMFGTLAGAGELATEIGTVEEHVADEVGTVKSRLDGVERALDLVERNVKKAEHATTESVPSVPTSTAGGDGGWSGSGGGGQAIPFTVTGHGTGADIVAAARSHLGAPYVWGADGPNAFDCSGLVHVALNEAGIEIGDATAAGYQASGHLITGPPQPGDIVFFGDPPSHCGIYIGDGKMINAPHTGDVVKVQDVAGGKSPITFRRFS